MASDDDLWRALANPIRRRLLDALRQGPRTTGQLSAAVPSLSRYAVMQHLGVLTDAGHAFSRRRGREQFNHLNPVPYDASMSAGFTGSRVAPRPSCSLSSASSTAKETR